MKNNLTSKARPYIILLWYRPPSDNKDTFEKLENVLLFLEHEGKEVILLGDTNCDLSDANSPCHVKSIKDIYATYGLKQLIKEPTRVTVQSSTLIDHIAVSDTDNIVESGVLKITLSDHYLVYAVRKFQGGVKRQHKFIRTRQMKNFSEEAFLSELRSVDWQSILRSSSDVREIVHNFTSVLSAVIEKYAPLVEKRVSDKYSPWLSPELKQLFNTRDKIKIAAVKNKSEILMSAYRQLRNKATKLNKEAKRAYFTNKIQASEGNLKETWATINKLVNKRSKTTNISSLTVDGSSVSDSVGIANSMNEFFCNVGNELCKDIPDTENGLLKGEYTINPTNATFIFSPVVSKQVMLAMSKFKTSNGFGLDEISSFFLKAGLSILAEPLSQLFNLSLSAGIFPDQWKIARIAPIYKDGKSDNRSNYRPISVLPVISRLFEKLVYDQYYNFLVSGRLLYSQQSSFRLLHSVLTCLLKCTNDWYLNIENGTYTSVTFIDLKKAFDTVNHEILINKLKLYGVAGKELRWFQSYLSNRKQCCKVNGKLSDLGEVTCGVPQGSCLGPLLFIIYINDLPLSIKHSQVNMYADDTSLSFSSNSISTINEKVNEDLECLNTWLAGNKLSLNVAKTNSIVIGSRKKVKDIQRTSAIKPSLVIRDEEISMIEHTKYLGVHVDQYLSWDAHNAEMIKKISRALGMIRHAKQYLPLSVLQTMYRSMVEPYFRFCCPVWGVCGATALNKLQKLQNRAARIVTNSPYRMSAPPIIKQLGWLTVNDLIETETLKMVYRSINHEAPDYLTGLFQRLSETSARQLRNTSTDLNVPFLRTACGQKCFSYRGAKLWNDLTRERKMANTFTQFKSSLKNDKS